MDGSKHNKNWLSSDGVDFPDDQLGMIGRMKVEDGKGSYAFQSSFQTLN